MWFLKKKEKVQMFVFKARLPPMLKNCKGIKHLQGTFCCTVKKRDSLGCGFLGIYPGKETICASKFIYSEIKTHLSASKAIKSFGTITAPG